MAYQYVGAGEHFSGIPARDLSAAEFAALTPEQQALVQASPLYVPIEPEPPSTKAEQPAAN